MLTENPTVLPGIAPPQDHPHACLEGYVYLGYTAKPNIYGSIAARLAGTRGTPASTASRLRGSTGTTATPYGTDVNFPVTRDELNNPQFKQCTDRAA